MSLVQAARGHHLLGAADPPVYHPVLGTAMGHHRQADVAPKLPFAAEAIGRLHDGFEQGHPGRPQAGNQAQYLMRRLTAAFHQQRLVSRLRFDFSKCADDPEFEALFRRLVTHSPLFNRLWRGPEFSLHSFGPHRFTHARFGLLTFEHTSYIPDGHPYIRVVICTPENEAARRATAIINTSTAVRVPQYWRIRNCFFAGNGQSGGNECHIDAPLSGSLIKNNVFGTVEAVKAVSELYTPLAGEVVEVNERLDKEPALVNTSPYGDGWMIKLRVKDAAEKKGLMGPEEYGAHIGS